MFMLPPSVKIYVARDPVDMRKSFNGLEMLTRNVLKKDPLTGHLFVFFNRRRDRVKILWWHQGGFCLFARRLERGCFWIQSIREQEMESMKISSRELSMILEGVDIKKARIRNNWRPL